MFGQQSQLGQTQAGTAAPAKAGQKRKASDIIELDSGGEGEDEDTPMVIDDDEEQEDSRSKYRAGDDVESTIASATHAAQPRRSKIPLSACDLTSIQELRQNVEQEKHAELTSIIQRHTFVGVVDMRLGQSMLQHLTKLFLVDHDALSEELFYQLGLRQFGNLGRLHLKPPPSLRELLEIAIEGETDSHQSGMTQEEILEVSIP
jgi:DNA mismatch repair protein MLH1